MAGVGTELTRLFAKAGVSHTNDCQCGNNAETLDACGVEWCEHNIPSIVVILRNEASKRGIPFMEVVATMIVKQAIRNAKRRR